MQPSISNYEIKGGSQEMAAMILNANKCPTLYNFAVIF